MKHTVLFLILLLHVLTVPAQQPSSLRCHTAEKPPRTMTYHPDNGDIVCVNGDNRYTRALYGTETLYRLETSDRPLFATYDKRNNRNITFHVTYNGCRIPLDSTSWCESRYRGGIRTYRLRDHRWGGGELHLVAIASQHDEAALFRFTSTGFHSDVAISLVSRPTRKNGMHREGDLGMEPRESYDAKPGSSAQTADAVIKGSQGIAVFRLANGAMPEAETTPGTLTACFDSERQSIVDLTSILRFSTPDSFINTLDANLVAAANGLWDGTTWLHGCIGWRMPLAGWRAAYLADVLGWGDRAKKHFEAYAKSQVTEVEPIYPHPTQDTTQNLARAEKRWGTQMYSNGYICRNPENNTKMHHYDMNLNYIDELLWHFCYDADTAMMARMWDVLERHLAWEKRNFDPDGDHLYDAYCCIWASDALWYSGGAVTHSSAYNYRGNLLAARIAEILGHDPTPYRTEAAAILAAMNRRLWIADRGHWAEYQDLMGYKRRHDSPALWSIYTPIDCGVTTPLQAWLSTQYVIDNIPHIPVRADGGAIVGHTLSTTDWMPYDWSTNNVAHAEVADMALAFFQAGRNDEGFALLKSDILDGMFLGASPGNFGQISYYDKARSEAYRDFGDNVGVTSRALVNGLFGIRPDALHGRCILQPAFPAHWDSASVSTPYITYRYERNGTTRRLHVTQRFAQPLTVVWRISLGDGQFADITGTADPHQHLQVDEQWLASRKSNVNSSAKVSLPPIGHSSLGSVGCSTYGLDDLPDGDVKTSHVTVPFNACVDDIFRNRYLTPRPPYTTLQIPLQGIGEWCLPKKTAAISDSIFRTCIVDGIFHTPHAITFTSPSKGDNIAYTSLFDNYPDSIDIAVGKKATRAWLLMAGSTNNMQSRIDNGIVVALYTDGTTDTLHLRNPDNWCPIEQDYFIDGLAFSAATPRPYRVHLGSGTVSRNILAALHAKGIVATTPSSAADNAIPSGAAQILCFNLNPGKRVKTLRLKPLSNEVVMGIMAVTLQKVDK